MPNLPSTRQMTPTNIQVVQSSQRWPYPQKAAFNSSSSPVGNPEDGRGDESTLSYGIGRLTIAPQPSDSLTTNIVLFGEPGVGKSAVINLIARKNVIRVPSGVNGCTLQSTRHHIDDMNLCIFETVGLEEPEIGINNYLTTLENAHRFVNELSAAGGVHLLLFCIRASRLTSTTQSNYRLFFEVAFQAKVPIALVLTGLEREVKMEDWWTKNNTAIKYYGLKSDGHACITGVTDHTPLQDYNHAESQKRIRDLLNSYRLRTSAPLPEPQDWFIRFGNGMLAFVEERRKPTRADVMNVLSMRLKLDRKAVNRFLDMMEQEGAQSSSRGGGGRLQHVPLTIIDSKAEAGSSKSATTSKSRYLGAGEWSDEPLRVGVVETAGIPQTLDPARRVNEPPRRRAMGEAGMPPFRDWNTTGEEDEAGRWDDDGRKRDITAGKAKTEPRKMSAPTEKYVKSEGGVSMDDIRSNFPPDLTGYVTKSSEFPFASGSYGDVYKGKLSMKEKTVDVAIKVYKLYTQLPENLPERIKKFRKEICVWVKLNHPNILPLFGTIRDLNVHPDIPAMVCPWIEGGALLVYLERNKDLAIAKRLALINDVAHGLQYLHSQHVVHGDLSGSNVLVHASGRACIADFGLSKLLTAIGEPSVGTSGQNKGTVRWMAPELLDPKAHPTGPSPRSDVYSFGSLMLEILTGNVPYHHLSLDVQVIYAISRGERPDRSNHKAVTNGRWKFIERCWSVNPREPRPSSDEIVGFVRRELAESGARV